MGRGGKFLFDDPNADEVVGGFFWSCLPLNGFILTLEEDDPATGNAWA